MSDWKQIGTVTRAWRDGDRVMAEVALDDGGALSAVISTRDVGIAGYALDDDGLDQIAAKSVVTPYMTRPFDARVGPHRVVSEAAVFRTSFSIATHEVAMYGRELTADERAPKPFLRSSTIVADCSEL